MVARHPYRCNARLYENYYLNQSGNGLPVYVGGRTLHGSGLGSILGGIFRAAVPLLKQGGKALLREGARTGLSMASDVLSGQNLKTAVKRRTKQAGERLLNQAVSRVTSGTAPSTKRIKPASRLHHGQKKKKRKTTRTVRQGSRVLDIFD